MTDQEYLKLAVEQARISVEQGGFPAGAVIVKDGNIIAKGISIGTSIFDPSAHAETASLRQACAILKTVDLKGATLYGSLEPCLMCFSCANWSNVSRIVYGSKKTADMIAKNYYEGNNNINDINLNNNHRIDLVYLPDFEEDMAKLIREWEAKFTSNA